MISAVAHLPGQVLHAARQSDRTRPFSPRASPTTFPKRVSAGQVGFGRLGGMATSITYSWRGGVTNDEIHALHAGAVETRPDDETGRGWGRQTRGHHLRGGGGRG